jgi:hypothetical protein
VVVAAALTRLIFDAIGSGLIVYLTVPPSSPPPTIDEDRFTVAPAARFHQKSISMWRKTQYTTRGCQTDTDKMFLDTDALGEQAEAGQD